MLYKNENSIDKNFIKKQKRKNVIIKNRKNEIKLKVNLKIKIKNVKKTKYI